MPTGHMPYISIFMMFLRAAVTSFIEAVSAYRVMARVGHAYARHYHLNFNKIYIPHIFRFPGFWWLLFRARTARRICIKRHDNGFFANFLAVLDLLTHTRPDCKVFVDWVLTGDEGHFRYGDIGTNVWDQIFAPLSSQEEFDSAPEGVVFVHQRLTPFFRGQGRDLLYRDSSFRRIRLQHHGVFRDRIRIQNEYVFREVEQCRARMKGRSCLGVHKRLSLPQVANNQLAFRMPTNEQLIQAVEEIIRTRYMEKPLVYLATDDADCVVAFMTHFGRHLFYRDGVQRCHAGNNQEVHTQSWGCLGVKDACDVLIDALLLADCDRVLHLSSNVTTCVALLNPETDLIHFEDIGGAASA
jgi:hypothetical protein